jgi:hypothetical protein
VVFDAEVALLLMLLPLNCAELPAQIATSLPAFAVGETLTVTVLVAVAFGHPPEPRTVYVIVAVPAETPEITPVEAFTLAIPELSDVQVPPAVPLLVKVVVAPTHAVCVPLRTPALAPTTTVIGRVALAFPQAPPFTV